MDHKKIAQKIQRKLQKGIKELIDSGHLPQEILKLDSEATPRRKLHSRIQGLLARMNIGKNWVIDVERALKPNKKGIRQFRPDILIFTPRDKLAAVIEYESINSSDRRIVDKDIKNYKDYIKYPSEEDGLPIVWVIITSLIKDPVENEDWSDWSCKNKKDWKDLIKSPFSYWKDLYIKEIKKSQNQKCPLFWININKGKVIIEFPRQKN